MDENTFWCRYWVESDWDDYSNEYIPAGFREEISVVATTRGKAKFKFIHEYLWKQGYDAKWADKYSIRKE